MEKKIEIPDEVKRFCELLKVDIIGKPEQKQPPGFHKPVWIVPIKDVGTGEVIKLIMGHPTGKTHLYKVVRILNKLHKTITVLTFAEEADKLEPKVIPMTTVREKVDVSKRKVPIKKPKPVAFDWSGFKASINRFYKAMPHYESLIKDRKAVALYQALYVLASKLEVAIEMLKTAEPIREGLERKEKGIKVLTDEDIKRLWEMFAKELREEGINPEVYKDRFESLIDPFSSYEDNEFIILDEAKKIIAEKMLEKAKYKMKIPAKKFSWKYIGWGFSALKFEIENLIDSIEAKDLFSTYKNAQEVLRKVRSIMSILELLPEVDRFKSILE